MKNPKLFFVFVFLVIFIAAFNLQAAKKIGSGQYRIADYRWMQANQMNMPLTNYGIFGQTINGNAGFYWPSGFPNETYIFGAGIWVGGLVRKINDPTKFDTEVTCGYNPNSGGDEFIQGIPGHASDPDQKIYFSSDSDWPLKDAQGRDSILSILDSYYAYNDYDASRHFVPENKPLNITVIQQTYAYLGPGIEDILFFVFNVVLDSSADTVHDAFLGVCADNDIGNESGASANDLVGFDRARNMAFQWQNDPESGWAHFPGTIAYKFLQGPPSNGVDTVHTYKDPYGTTKVDSIVIHPTDTLGMTAFKIFTIDIDPADKFQRYQIMSGYNYKTLDSNNVEDSYHPYDVDVYGPSDKRFLQTAGPFNLIPGDTAKVIYAILIAKDTSELPLKADEAQAIFDAGFLNISPEAPESPDLYGIPHENKVTLYWENAPEFKPDRHYEVTSKDSIWKHTSSSVSIKIPNMFYNPEYRKYDFEGYRVWRSIYSDPSTFQMLAYFDKYDSLQILRQDSAYDIVGDSFVITKAETLGFDTGLQYTFTDTNIPYTNIRYYYAVTSFDANYLSYKVDSISGDTVGTEPYSFESQIKENMISVIPSYQHELVSNPHSIISFEYGNSALSYVNVIRFIDAYIFDDILDDSTTYHMRFGPITVNKEGNPVYSFGLDTMSGKNRNIPPYDSSNHFPYHIETLPKTIVDSTYKNSLGAYEYDTSSFWISKRSIEIPLFGALIGIDSISVCPTNNKVDSIMINDATVYTDTLVLTDSTPYAGTHTHINSDPYYNGGSFKITWHRVYVASEGDSALTCDVYDMVNGIEIPYSPNWDFGWRFGMKDSTAGGGSGKYMSFLDSTADNWKAMYIDGVSVFFNYHAGAIPPIPSKRILSMSQSDKPAEGDTWYIYNTACPTPSLGNSYTIKFSEDRSGIRKNMEISKYSSITVSPNPYLISSPSRKEGKGLMFKGLPGKCDISIYSINGSLIRRIEHRSSVDDGVEYWDVKSGANTKITSGVYFYMVETLDNRLRKTGKIVLIR